MKKTLLAAAIAATAMFAAEPVEADNKTLNAGYPFCVSEKAYDELSSAHAKRDNRMMNYLAETGQCGVIKAGLKYTTLDNDAWTIEKVRVWLPDGNHADIWVPIEATMPSKKL